MKEKLNKVKVTSFEQRTSERVTPKLLFTSRAGTSAVMEFAFSSCFKKYEYSFVVLRYQQGMIFQPTVPDQTRRTSLVFRFLFVVFLSLNLTVCW
jgi:hypothetical protein